MKIPLPFKKKKQQRSFITNVPEFETTEDLMDYVSNKWEQQNAQLRADNHHLKEEVDELKKKVSKKESNEEEKIIEDEILRKRDEAEFIKGSKTLKLRIDGLKEKWCPTFFLRNNLPFHRFKGIVIREMSDGRVVYFPWIYNLKTRENMIFNKPVANFEDFFRDNIGIVSQINGGKVDSNFDFDEDGNPMIIMPKFRDIQNGKNVEIIHMDDVEKREYELQIESLKDKLNEYHGKILFLDKNRSEMEKDMADMELNTNASKAEKEQYASAYALNSVQQINTTKEVADLAGSVQDMLQMNVLTSRENQVLRDSYNRLIGKLGDRLWKSETEINEAKTKSIVNDAVSKAQGTELLYKMMEKLPSSTPPQQRPLPQGGM